MPDCVLRVHGPSKKVRAFLSRTTLKPCTTYFAGEPITPASSRVSRRSGFNVVASRADGDLPAQVRDALRFLERHAEELKELRDFFGPGHGQLDFGLWESSSDENPWPRFRLPHTLVSAAARYGFEIKLSFYGPPGGE